MDLLGVWERTRINKYDAELVSDNVRIFIILHIQILLLRSAVLLEALVVGYCGCNQACFDKENNKWEREICLRKQ